MSSFTNATTEPVLLENGKPYKKYGRKCVRMLAEDGISIRYHIGWLGSGLILSMRHGFVTDLGSIPKLVRPMIPQRVLDKAEVPFAFHDLLREDERFTLLEGDALFLCMLETRGVDPFWRDLFFKCVRTNSSRVKINPQYMPSGSEVPLRGSNSES